MRKKNIEKIKKSTFFKDERLPFVEARFVLDSDYHYTEHFHETLSIGAIEHGQVAYMHEDDYYVLKEHELAVINPYIVHACNPIEKQSRTYHMTYIDEQWCKGIQETIFDDVQEYIPISGVNLYDKVLYKKYLELNYSLLSNEYLYIEKEELLYNFLVKLFTKYCDTKITKSVASMEAISAVEKAKVFMQENVYENLTIQDMCDHVGLSEFHFIRLFKEVSFTTPHSFLLNLKINEVKKRLANDENIAEVASSVGFFDQSHLNRVFKQFVAATPFQYKRSLNSAKS